MDQIRSSTSRKRGRTPLDDAPPCDPSEWSTAEMSFIEAFSRRVAEAQLRRQQDTTDTPVAEPTVPGNDSAARDTVSSFHTLPLFQPQSVLARLFHYFFPDWYRRYQGNLSDSALRQLTNEDLLTLMQLALAAGERERSSIIARELSRRRVRIGVAGGLAANPMHEQRPPSFAPDRYDTTEEMPESNPFVWVAGMGEGSARSSSGALYDDARHRVATDGSGRQKMARLETNGGGRRQGRPVPSQRSSSWWGILRRIAGARDGEGEINGSADDVVYGQTEENPFSAMPRRRPASRAPAPGTPPEPPSFLNIPRSAGAAMDQASHDRHDDRPTLSVDALGTPSQMNVPAARPAAKTTATDGLPYQGNPLNPDAAPPRYLSEAVERGARSALPDPARADAPVKGQLRPSRAVPAHGLAPIWGTQRPPLARHSGQATARPPNRGELTQNGTLSDDIPRWDPSPATETTRNNWWRVKEGQAAASPISTVRSSME